MMPSGSISFKSLIDLRDIRLLHFAVPRSGSVFVWQVLCDLLGDGVMRTHDYIEMPPEVPVIATIRDWRDCVVSHWRKDHPGRGRMPREHVVHYVGWHVHWIWLYEQYLARTSPVVWTLQYEEWIENPQHIFSVVFGLLGRATALQHEDRLIARHSLEANRAISEDPDRRAEAHILPNHCHEGEVGSWKRFVDGTVGDLLNSLLHEQLERHGYS